MAFNIYDRSLVRIGEINTIISSVWQEKYCDRGACQLVVTDSPTAARLLVPDNFVGKTGGNTLWQIKTKEKRDGLLWANGFTSNYTLLDDRIYDGIHKSSVIETDLRAAVIGKRPAPIVGLTPARGLTGAVLSEHTYPTLFALCKDLCASADYGFRFLHDKVNKKLLFDVYQGVERPNAKFSEPFGNLAHLVLQQSNMDFKNMAYVGGSGREEERIYTEAGQTSAAGLDRREMFVDARDLRHDETEQTIDEFKALLRQRGLEKLNENNQKLSVSFEVNTEDFGKSFTLGDVIYCVLPEDDLKLFVRVIAFEETIENNAASLSITVGTPIIQTIGG